MHTDLVCPRCHQSLIPEGVYLRCAQHGLFFRYGPHRLLTAPTPAVNDDYLMPWQTLTDEAPVLLELPTTATTAAPK
ncbi:MAG: hypothetical protein KatS3mg055_1967 [Chloroflexus sp.]|uniref:hypothetical protein n=1 Tax=Chloroflexus sp. TaxID=1904827 RepID=UPI0021DC97BB|nr:hypothetical protein [Chloroflexus sp.]GIV89449.1 MAG: hypothetical protein KatS3mg055_1967 [Chloroflexus sp.]